MRRRLRSLPKSPPLAAVLMLTLLAGACSGGDDATDGAGPEAPGGTLTSTTAGTAPSSPPTTAATFGQEPTTETTGAPGVTTSAGPTTSAPPAGDTTTTTGGPGRDGDPTSTTVAVTSTTVDPDGPVVSIGADDYRFTVEECVYYDGVDIAVWGPGEAPDGTPSYLDMQIDMLRIDIGTQERFQEMDEHWLAGVGANDDLVVSVDGFEVTVTGTFVRSPGGESVHGELVVDCPLG